MIFTSLPILPQDSHPSSRCILNCSTTLILQQPQRHRLPKCPSVSYHHTTVTMALTPAADQSSALSQANLQVPAPYENILDPPSRRHARTVFVLLGAWPWDLAPSPQPSWTISLLDKFAALATHAAANCHLTVEEFKSLLAAKVMSRLIDGDLSGDIAMQECDIDSIIDDFRKHEVARQQALLNQRGDGSFLGPRDVQNPRQNRNPQINTPPITPFRQGQGVRRQRSLSPTIRTSKRQRLFPNRSTEQPNNSDHRDCTTLLESLSPQSYHLRDALVNQQTIP